MAHLQACRKLGVKAVIGTTGFSAEQKAEIAEIAKEIAIVLSPNMSVGVNVTFKLLELAAKALSTGYDIEVVEAHHGNFTQDGKLFMALNRGPGKDSRGREVAFFDSKSKKLIHRLTTASNGVGHTYNTPDGKQAVVTNYGNNVISIIDLKKPGTVKDLKIGSGRMGHVAFTRDGKWGYVSNDKDGSLYKLDMGKLEVVKKIATGEKPGGGQVLNVWTNVFEELPRK